MVDIVEAYSAGWQPPRRVRPAVEHMVVLTPERYLHGLGAIVLTNASGLPRRRRTKTRSRGRKVAIEKCRGLYHHASPGGQAWIELFVDNILDSFPPWALRSRLILDSAVGEVFFHELGHHIHSTHRREFREREDVADRWSKDLLRAYLRRRHRLLRLLFVPAIVAYRLWRSCRRLWAGGKAESTAHR